MIKNFSLFCKKAFSKQALRYQQKSFFNQFARSKFTNSNKIILCGSAVTVFGGLFYTFFDQNKLKLNIFPAYCASFLKSQESVYSQTKNHALYLTIHLRPDASVKEILKKVANLKKYVDKISPIDLRSDENEILAGVGFGPNFLTKARPTNPGPSNFSYHTRKGQFGEMPSTGGDIFIHAKCDEISKLFELAQIILKELPENSIENFEDIYGWVYRYGRDLSGFIDGTENPASTDHRQEVAVNATTGGSYVITQKWIHKFGVINREKDEVLEGYVGRKRSDSTELKRKSTTSHVARMTGGPNFEQKKKFEIVRQSQPFGTLSGENGLFFIGYSANVEALDYMLNRMVGATEDGLGDDIMKISNCVKSTYWYFPGQQELEDLVK